LLLPLRTAALRTSSGALIQHNPCRLGPNRNYSIIPILRNSMPRRTPYRRCNFLALFAKNCHRSDTSLHRKQTFPERRYLHLLYEIDSVLGAYDWQEALDLMEGQQRPSHMTAKAVVEELESVLGCKGRFRMEPRRLLS